MKEIKSQSLPDKDTLQTFQWHLISHADDIEKLKHSALHFLKVSETENLNMHINRIINVGYPRNPEEDPAFDGDADNTEALNDKVQNMNRIFLRTDGRNQMTERLDMNNHRITDLLAPDNNGDAAKKRYVALLQETQAVRVRVAKLKSYH